MRGGLLRISRFISGYCIPLAIVLVFFTSNIFSQSIGTLRGFVSDSTTSEALPYGNVYLHELNTGASTDSIGYFLIPSVPAGKNIR